jgi:hypothetical protein
MSALIGPLAVSYGAADIGPWRTDTSSRGTTTFVPAGRSRGPLLYVFPGIDGFPYGGGITSGAEWIRKVLPAGMASIGAVVVARKSSAPWPEVQADAAASLAKLGYAPTFSSAMGFSGGAATLLGAPLTTAGWRRVMLVDPSIPPAMQRAVTGGGPIPGIDSRVEMTFHAGNWGGFKSIQAAMRPLADAINRAGGKAVEIKQYHAKFVYDAFAAMQQRPSDPSLFGAERPSFVSSDAPAESRAVARRKRAPNRRASTLRRNWLLAGLGAVGLGLVVWLAFSGGKPTTLAVVTPRANPRRRRLRGRG